MRLKRKEILVLLFFYQCTDVQCLFISKLFLTQKNVRETASGKHEGGRVGTSRSFSSLLNKGN